MTWFSIHFYPLDNQDVFLVRSLRPFLQQHIWSTRGTHAFYIRYQDERGPHLRIRFRGAADWMDNTFRPAFEAWQVGLGDWEEVPYLPETERFGGEKALSLSEEYFHLSTRVVLERLTKEQHTYGDAMFDALRMHTIAAHGAGMAQEEAATYFLNLTQAWLPLYWQGETADPITAAEEVLRGFAQVLEQQHAALQGALQALWTTLDKEKFDKKQPEWARWALGNQMILKALDQDLARALPSLLHLTNNRLGLNNQDEVYLLYILANTL